MRKAAEKVQGLTTAYGLEGATRDGQYGYDDQSDNDGRRRNRNRQRAQF